MRKRRRDALDRRFDEQFGTNTAGIVEVRHLVPDPDSAEHVVFYQPSPVGKLRAMLGKLPIRFEDFTFVDYGSGKGRALLVAAEHPFRAIRGVEFVEELHLVAERNIASMAASDLRCKDVRSICNDATQFPVPNGPVVCYFFTPFRGPILDRVLRNIIRSIETTPREALVVYYGGDTVVMKQIDDLLEWEMSELELPHDASIDHQRWCRIHHHRAADLRGDSSSSA